MILFAHDAVSKSAHTFRTNKKRRVVDSTNNEKNNKHQSLTVRNAWIYRTKTIKQESHCSGTKKPAFCNRSSSLAFLLTFKNLSLKVETICRSNFKIHRFLIYFNNTSSILLILFSCDLVKTDFDAKNYILYLKFDCVTIVIIARLLKRKNWFL